MFSQAPNGYWQFTSVFARLCYLNDFLRQSGLQPLEMFPVRDEQLEHVTGHLSHCFIPKLDKTKAKDDNWPTRESIRLLSP